MAVLVTGGAGFIGSHVVERLLSRGEPVVCVDDFNNYYDPAIKRQNIASALANPAYQLVDASITDNAALTDVFASHDIRQVVHLAGRAGVRPSVAEPLLYEQVNVHASVQLLALSQTHHVERFVFGSSSSVYGTTDRRPFREDDPADHPISPYAATKRAAELQCYTYHHLYGLPVTALRFFTVYGPRQRPDLAIHKFTRAIYQDEEIPIYGDGTTARDYTYIDDIVDGIIAALDRTPALGYEIINLGSSTPIVLRDLVALLERTTGRTARIRREAEQPGDVQFTFADTAKAQQLLGWRPSMPFEEGIRRFVAWYDAARVMA